MRPWTPEPPEEVEPDPNASDNPPQASPGYWYMLHRGDTLQDVADVAKMSRQLTVTVEANQVPIPRVNPNRLKAGEKIFVPVPSLVPSIIAE